MGQNSSSIMSAITTDISNQTITDILTKNVNNSSDVVQLNN